MLKLSEIVAFDKRIKDVFVNRKHIDLMHNSIMQSRFETFMFNRMDSLEIDKTVIFTFAKAIEYFDIGGVSFGFDQARECIRIYDVYTDQDYKGNLVMLPRRKDSLEEFKKNVLAIIKEFFSLYVKIYPHNHEICDLIEVCNKYWLK